MTTTSTAPGLVGPRWGWGDRLRKVRRMAGMSQAAMAQTVGVKPTTYSAWEGGRSQPGLRLAQQVAARIERRFPGRVSAGWMLLDSDDDGWLPRMDSNHQPSDYRRKGRRVA